MDWDRDSDQTRRKHYENLAQGVALLRAELLEPVYPLEAWQIVMPQIQLETFIQGLDNIESHCHEIKPLRRSTRPNATQANALAMARWVSSKIYERFEGVKKKPVSLVAEILGLHGFHSINEEAIRKGIARPPPSPIDKRNFPLS